MRDLSAISVEKLIYEINHRSLNKLKNKNEKKTPTHLFASHVKMAHISHKDKYQTI